MSNWFTIAFSVVCWTSKQFIGRKFFGWSLTRSRMTHVYVAATAIINADETHRNSSVMLATVHVYSPTSSGIFFAHVNSSRRTIRRSAAVETAMLLPPPLTAAAAAAAAEDVAGDCILLSDDIDYSPASRLSLSTATPVHRLPNETRSPFVRKAASCLLLPRIETKCRSICSSSFFFQAAASAAAASSQNQPRIYY